MYQSEITGKHNEPKIILNQYLKLQLFVVYNNFI